MNTRFQLAYRSMLGGKIWVQRIPGDGNCLYGSLVHQLWRIHPTDPRFSEAALQMRTVLVEFIRNLPRYWDHLLPFAEDLIKSDCLDDYDRLRKYLTLLARDGIWGGEESLSAACEVFAVNIVVWQQCTGQPITYYSSQTSTTTVTLCYTGTHYDSVLWTTKVTLENETDVRLVDRGGEILKVTPFSGFPGSLYQAFLHQLHILPDEGALNILQLSLKDFFESAENSGNTIDFFD